MNTLKIGDSISPATAPDVEKKPFSIQCEVDAKGASGVIVSHGGSAIGYALYVKEQRAVFAIRHGKEITRATSGPLPEGKVKIEASLGEGGAMSLQVGGSEPATAKAPGLLGKQPSEDFDLGFDAKNTVDDYDGMHKFTGSILNLVIE